MGGQAKKISKSAHSAVKINALFTTVQKFPD